MMSSIASRGSESAAAIVSMPAGPPPNELSDQREVAPVHRIEPDVIDIEEAQHFVGDGPCDFRLLVDNREIANPAQKPPCDARRAARALGDFIGAIVGDRGGEHPRGAPHDAFQFRDGVEFEPQRNTKPVAQRRRQKSGSRRCANQREALEGQLDRAGTRPLANDEIEFVILHGRIEDFLDRRIETMNFVDEEHIAVFEPGQLGREIARFRDDRPGGRMESGSEFAGDDFCESRLAEPRRPNEEHMIERLLPCFRSLDEDLQIFPRGFLAGEVGERQGAQGDFGVIVAFFWTNESRACWHRMRPYPGV